MRYSSASGPGTPPETSSTPPSSLLCSDLDALALTTIWQPLTPRETPSPFKHGPPTRKPSDYFGGTDKETLAELPTPERWEEHDSDPKYVVNDASSSSEDAPTLDLVPYSHSVLPYYDSKFKEALEAGAGIAETIVNILRDCPREARPLQLLHEAEDLSEYDSPVEKLVGIVGNSGHGKSSLINSLLDVDLATTGSSGSAVTAFVIEYRHCLPHHISKYTIDTTCFAGDQLQEQLELLLEDYRYPFITDLKDREEIESVYARSQAAGDTFIAAFGNARNFNISHLHYEENDISKASAISLLRSWSENLPWPAGMRDGHLVTPAADVEECQQATDLFVQRGLWPFVDTMCIYLETPLLKDGLVLADLPGYHDVNFARVRAARQYQARCHELFVVSNISRAVDDPILKDVIHEQKAKAQNLRTTTKNNVTVVCTHSASLSDKKKLEKLADPVDVEMAQKAIRDLNGPASREAYAEVDHRYNAVLIGARNKKVEATIQKTYADEVAPSKLPVFSVDNLLYREPPTPAATRTSCIPQLRDFVQSLPAQALFEDGNLFLTVKLTALINSFELWVRTVTSKEAQTRVHLADVNDLYKCNIDIELWESEMTNEFDSRIRMPLGRNKNNIINDARVTCSSWHRFHPSSLRSWFRHNGTHYTTAVGYACWNTELATCLKRVTAQEWHRLFQEADRLLQKSHNTIIGRFTAFRTQSQTLGCPESFSPALDAREGKLRAATETIRTRFTDGLRTIQHNATGGHVASYMVEYMMPAYRQGLEDAGTGVTARRHHLLSTHVGRDAFVVSHSNCIAKHINALLTDATQALQAAVDEGIAAVEADVAVLKLAGKESVLAGHEVYRGRLVRVLEKVKSDEGEVERLASRARVDARVRYG